MAAQVAQAVKSASGSGLDSKVLSPGPVLGSVGSGAYLKKKKKDSVFCLDSSMQVILFWISLESDPKMRVYMQVVYLSGGRNAVRK